ncbi:MAG: type-4 uracil-DNA glycosylase [Nitrososphaerota archaeon]
MSNKNIIIEEISKEIRKCKKCRLHLSRKNPVPGEGNINSSILIIGEAPGYFEDIQGKPFVGQAGKILDELLSIANLNREKVFITNIVKCRPPENRVPRNDEIDSCKDFLEKQIEIINPKIIITLGNVSTQYIFNKYGLEFKSMSRIHGKIFDIIEYKIKVIPLYHPAAALYNPKIEKIMKNDWKKISLIFKKT